MIIHVLKNVAITKLYIGRENERVAGTRIPSQT